jgi:hypothetical protein
LQKPLAQGVTVGVGHWPFALQTAAAVVLPFVHVGPAPHGVPGDLLPVSTHADMPVAQDVAPLLQTLAGVQVLPWVHGEQVPFRQKRLVPHGRPFETAAPVSLQTGAPLAQESVPLWHLLAGVHVSPLRQATQTPALLQTWFVPHEAPGALLAFAMQADVPVSHAVVPSLQGSVGWQVTPAVHETHEPVRQTWFVPQEVPSFAALFESVHVGVPDMQLSVPVWHGLAGLHSDPEVHAPQAPFEQTWFVPHEVPAG